MSFHDIYALPISSVFAIMIVLSTGWAIIGIITERYANAAIQHTLRVINGMLSFVFFIVVLRYTVFGRARNNDITIGFIRTIEQIQAQPELVREMIMNAFLFFPIGLTLSYALADQKTNRIFFPLIVTILISFFLSSLLELIQGIFSIGNTELSDIIMNTVGAIIGTSSFCVKSFAIKRVEKSRKN